MATKTGYKQEIQRCIGMRQYNENGEAIVLVIASHRWLCAQICLLYVIPRVQWHVECRRYVSKCMWRRFTAYVYGERTAFDVCLRESM